MTWCPGWDSIDGAKWWSDFYFWFGIVCLFLLGISEVISHRYGLRKDELVVAAERAAGNQRKNETADAETRRKAEVEGLQKQLSESDKKVADLQYQQIPRHLSPEQKATLLTSLTRAVLKSRRRYLILGVPDLRRAAQLVRCLQ